MNDHAIHPLRAARQNFNLTQKRLAWETGVAPQTIMRAEQNKPINADSRRRLCEYFHMTSDALGLVNDKREQRKGKCGKDEALEPALSQTRSRMIVRGQVLAAQELESTDMEQSRRDFLQALGITGTSLAASSSPLLYPPLWERLSRVLAQPSNMDNETLLHLEAIVRDSWHVLPTMLGTFSQSLLQYVLQRLEIVTQLLSTTLATEQRICIASVAAELTQIAGELLFDMKESEQADRYYAVGLEAARVTQNPLMQVTLLGRRSFIPIYEERPEKAVPWLQQANAIARRGVPSITQAWLAAIEAEAYANLHQTQDSLQALQKAEYFLEQNESRHSVENTHTRFSHTVLLGYQGICNLKLQRPKAALPVLQAALKHMDGARTRHQTIVLTDIATAYLQLGEVEGTLHYIDRALETLKQVKSARVLQRLNDLNHALAPWKGLSDVKQLDEKLLAIRPLIAQP